MTRIPSWAGWVFIGACVACNAEGPAASTAAETHKPGTASAASPIVADPSCTAKVGCAGQLQVQQLGTAAPLQPLAKVADYAPLGADKPVQFDFALRNVATGVRAAPLTGLEISVFAVDGDDWQCLASAGQPCNGAQWPALLPVGSHDAVDLGFSLRYQPKQDGVHKAKVCVRTPDDPALGEDGFCFFAVHAAGAGKLTVQPQDLLFSGDWSPSPQIKTLTLRNSGLAPLTIDQAELQTGGDYVLVADGTEIYPTGFAWPISKQLAPEQSAVWLVRRAPGSSDLAGGTLRFYVKSAGKTATVDAKVAVAPPPACLSAAPKIADWGSVSSLVSNVPYVVKITNCGSTPGAVTGASVANDAAGGAFAIDWLASSASPGGEGISLVPTAINPMWILPGKAASLVVNFNPLHAGDAGGTLFVESSSTKLTIPLAAHVVETTNCPIAKVTVVEGEQVIPQTTIHLKGNKSLAPYGGAIKKYNWTVKQPTGSNQALTPNPSFVNPTLLANASGEYEFCLDVWDSYGVKSCVSECAKVLVIPNNALHVELLWDTPNDTDQTDNGPAAGADLDLHFAHPLAGTLDLDCDGVKDPWFSNPWDTFWFNAAPEWGDSGNNKDNPMLDLDDTDGAGPENLNLIDPEGNAEKPVAYSVGVHYWNDYGFGTSYATVSLYIQGGLALQFGKIKMQPLDMWYVGKINWPNTASGGSKKIFDTCYQSGSSCAAGKNLMWQPKGDFCITPCYVNKVFNGSVGGAAKPSACQP